MSKPKPLVTSKRGRKNLPSSLKSTKPKPMNRDEILRAVKSQKPQEFYVWDDKSEDDKPLTKKEMLDGLRAYKESSHSPSVKIAAVKHGLPIDFVKDLILAKAEDKSLATPFVPIAKPIRNNINTDRYTYRVTWSAPDKSHSGLCAEFPSLSWLDKSPESALKGIRKIVAEVVMDMLDSNEQVPEPLSEKTFSGKFVVRVPAEIHRLLAVQAAEQGISMNRWVSAKLAA
jgi:predicted HicB family RNase H-like nuclease